MVGVVVLPPPWRNGKAANLHDPELSLVRSAVALYRPWHSRPDLRKCPRPAVMPATRVTSNWELWSYLVRYWRNQEIVSVLK